LITILLESHPDRLVGGLFVVALCAGACGIALDWRLRRAQSQALRDPLTGLPNRVLLEDRVEQALQRARRADESFALIVVDLDNFKDVNDVRGHRAGDAVLESLARRFEAVVRASDTVARVGGDEFVVLSLATGDDEQAAALVGRLRQALRRPFKVEGSTVEIDASIGWAVFPADGATADELLGRADGQMYATKRDSTDDSVLLRRGVDAGVVRDVESALERNELVVLYQPIIDLRTAEPRSAEALVRRVLPNQALELPAEFVPHVERTPLARELTFLVVTDALRSAEAWAAKNVNLGVSVNVPYRLLDDPQFIEGLRERLHNSAVSPAKVTLEAVPAGPGAGSELDATVIRHLRELGVRLSLDDLGRASSVAAIRMLPLHQVKIDSMFLHEAGRGGPADAIVRSLVGLAHGLGLETVAEGVESKLALEAAISLGCDYAQGFYLGHPMPAERLADWLAGTWPVVAVAT